MKKIDEKQSEENIELIKDANNPKRNYIFQNNSITKTGFFIIVAILVLIIIGIVISGVFFDSSIKNP
ncbi:hypothetical protein JQC67_07050 [Aurantibacter crassamenti]|uniref:hypothetical protein n=1 Tax=Aurantibacter crassamenti TaxID=1837375 RepID=UPI00193A4536|nr:hypothetical protein [Aurantibacter crassamenti]MBM1105888.1 hypothetical protein [Aurantibacter crassamenti]